MTPFSWQPTVFKWGASSLTKGSGAKGKTTAGHPKDF